MMQILQPPGWARAKGFSNGIAASGKLVFIAGQVGWTGEGKWQALDFAGQFRQALKNIIDVLAEAGGKQQYLGALKDVGIAYRALMGRHFPTMAVVQVGGLIEPEARLEIEATAVIPEDT